MNQDPRFPAVPASLLLLVLGPEVWFLPLYPRLRPHTLCHPDPQITMFTRTHDSIPPPAYTPARITSGHLPISCTPPCLAFLTPRTHTTDPTNHLADATLDVPDSVLPLVHGSYTLVLAATPQGRTPFGVEICDTQGRHRGWVRPGSSWDVMRLLDEGEAVGCVLTHRGSRVKGDEEVKWRSQWFGSIRWWAKQGGNGETEEGGAED